MSLTPIGQAPSVHFLDLDLEGLMSCPTPAREGVPREVYGPGSCLHWETVHTLRASLEAVALHLVSGQEMLCLYLPPEHGGKYRSLARPRSQAHCSCDIRHHAYFTFFQTPIIPSPLPPPRSRTLRSYVLGESHVNCFLPSTFFFYSVIASNSHWCSFDEVHGQV